MPLAIHADHLYSESQVSETPGLTHLELMEVTEKREGLTSCSFIIFEALPSHAAPVTLLTPQVLPGDLVAKVTSSLFSDNSIFLRKSWVIVSDVHIKIEDHLHVMTSLIWVLFSFHPNLK